MHQQLTRELAMSRIADYHRQAAMYRLGHAGSTVEESQAPGENIAGRKAEEAPRAPSAIGRWALAGVLLSVLVVGGVGL